MNCAGANLVPCRGSVQASDQYILLAGAQLLLNYILLLTYKVYTRGSRARGLDCGRMGGKNFDSSSSICLRSRENDFVRLMLVGIFVD